MFETPATPTGLIYPGDFVSEVELRFLCPEEVLPYMQEGIQFLVCEGKTVAEGIILRVEEDTSV